MPAHIQDRTDMTDTNAHLPDVSRFSAVDEVERPQQLIEVLDVAKRLPGFPAAKSQLLDRLGPERASSALDVGCGYGADVIELAGRLGPGGRAVGVDLSDAMITEARRRTAGIAADVGFQVADALALPFEDNSFDLARTETVLQHLAEPARAVSEMARVTRPGGRVGALELDQETMFLDHRDIELLASLRDSIISAMAQSSIGRQVPRLFVEAGLSAVQTVPHVITGNPHAFRLQFAHHVSELCNQGAITAERANHWWSAIDAAAAAEHFTGGITAFVVWGTVN
jgi:ubiquinone/menaquinone biosynthesis C-methylase UbiE